LETKESEALIEQVDGDDTKCRTGCIYIITNLITLLSYIGLTTREPETRWQEHEYLGRNPKNHFHRSIKKHGWENFKPEILAENIPIEELGDLEMYYIDLYDSYNNGYNSTKGGEGTLGHLRTEEQRMAKIKACTKNHIVEGGGSIYFHKCTNKWMVRACNTSEKYIGLYFTKEKAIEALELYNTSGKITRSDKLRRKRGTGCVSLHGEKWRAKAPKGKFIGRYFTKERAIKAVDMYNETGKIMPSDLTIGPGSIKEYSTKTKGKRYMGRLKINGTVYRTKAYGSRKQAQSELAEIRNKLRYIKCFNI
jgi:group I intron endonuclease